MHVSTCVCMCVHREGVSLVCAPVHAAVRADGWHMSLLLELPRWRILIGSLPHLLLLRGLLGTLALKFPQR